MFIKKEDYQELLNDASVCWSLKKNYEELKEEVDYLRNQLENFIFEQKHPNGEIIWNPGVNIIDEYNYIYIHIYNGHKVRIPFHTSDIPIDIDSFIIKTYIENKSIVQISCSDKTWIIDLKNRSSILMPNK